MAPALVHDVTETSHAVGRGAALPIG